MTTDVEALSNKLVTIAGYRIPIPASLALEEATRVLRSQAELIIRLKSMTDAQEELIREHIRAQRAAEAKCAELERDAGRLDFLLDKQGVIVWSTGHNGIRRCQLYQICEYGTGFAMSGKDCWFDTSREAIDASIAAQAGSRKKS